MKFSGRIFEVTNLSQFALSYATTNGKPKAGTFKPAANIRLHLSSIVPGFAASFLPTLSVTANLGAEGKFDINISEEQVKLLSTNKLVYAIAYRKVGTVEVAGQSVTILEPVYRSQVFDITKYKSKEHNIYFAPFNLTDKQGITQAQIDKQIKDAKKKFKDIENLSGTIQEGKVHVKGSGRGAEIQFNVELRPATSFNLDSFIRGKVKAVDIDLPGPDFLVGLCVSKDDIEKEVEAKIAQLMKEVNKSIKATLIDEVAKATGQNKSIVETLFNTQASVTFSKLRYPVVESKKIKLGFTTLTVNVRAVVPKLSIGFPRIVSA